MKIVVVGGNGMIGRQVIEKLGWAGIEAAHIDDPSASAASAVPTPDRQFAGVVAVIDARDPLSFHLDEEAERRALRTLLERESAAGIPHHISLSVVGTARPEAPRDLEAVLARERMIEDSRVPFTIVRTTQLFEDLDGMADDSTENGVVRLSSASMQPIACADVAEALAELVTADPANGVLEIAGPERAPLAEFVGTWLGAWDDSRMIAVSPDAPFLGSPLTDASLIPEPGATILSIHFDDWLSAMMRPAFG